MPSEADTGRVARAGAASRRPTNAEIGAKLGSSRLTVEVHIGRIQERCGCDRRTLIRLGHLLDRELAIVDYIKRMPAYERHPAATAMTDHQSRPGDLGYIDMDTFVRLELARRAEYEARPDIIAKREADRIATEQTQVEKNAQRRRPKLLQTTDYPWLKPGWVEAPVRPFSRK